MKDLYSRQAAGVLMQAGLSTYLERQVATLVDEITRLEYLNARSGSELDAMWQQRDDALAEVARLQADLQLYQDELFELTAADRLPQPPVGSRWWHRAHECWVVVTPPPDRPGMDRQLAVLEEVAVTIESGEHAGEKAIVKLKSLAPTAGQSEDSSDLS